LKENHETMTDVQLVQLALRTPDAYLYLIKRYETKLTRYIHRVTSVTREETEDLLQEIFIKVYRNLNGFNQKLKFSSWIYRIAHNEIINYGYKKRALLNIIQMDPPDSDSRFAIAETHREEEAGTDLKSRESHERIMQALKELPLKYREVLVLRFFDDKSYGEISDILRKPEGTVATLISRAKKKFRKIASEHQLGEMLEL